jgi:hypothetical protein
MEQPEAISRNVGKIPHLHSRLIPNLPNFRRTSAEPLKNKGNAAVSRRQPNFPNLRTSGVGATK